MKKKLRLCLDTAHQSCRVALFLEKELLQEKEFSVNSGYENFLFQLQNACFCNTEYSMKDVLALYCVVGPGSFTGIRISLAVAKCLAYALNKPLYKISSLDGYNRYAFISFLEKNKNIDKDKIIAFSLLDARNDRAYGLWTDFSKQDLIYSQSTVSDLLDWINQLKTVLTSKPNHQILLTADAFALIKKHKNILVNKKNDIDYFKEGRLLSFEKSFKWTAYTSLFDQIEMEQEGNPYLIEPEYLSLSQAERVHNKEIDLKGWRFINDN